MNKKSISFGFLFTLLLGLFFTPLTVKAESSTANGEFRVGMEAGYAPFNWTQTTDANGAVAIPSDHSYAGGYDVQIAKKVAEGLNKRLVIVKTKWDGLAPALQSGKIDAVIAGMSPTPERKKEIDFSDPYYESNLVIVTRKDSKYANAKSLTDFSGAKVTAQLNTFHYTVIDQIPDVQKQQAQADFGAMRTALASGVIDGYVSERPEGVTAESVNPDIKMVEFSEGNGFNTDPADTTIAIGLRKGDPNREKINAILADISPEERTKIMDDAIVDQPAAEGSTDEEQTKPGLISDFKNIISQYGTLFLRGTGTTLLLASIGTIVGTLIGLLIGVIRTIPTAEKKGKRAFQKIFNWLLSAYIEIFRSTPMMVQAMVIYYGIALAFGIDLNRTVAALFIVSINTGAYMSEIVRGGIFSVDKGQFEAAQAIGMTHGQTMTKIVLPQVIRNIMPATGNEFVINIKDTSVLSVISVSDLFFQANSAAGTNYQFFQTFSIVCVIYFVLTFTVTRILRWLENRIDGPSAYIPVEEAEQSVAIGEDK
ncbi:ABC transporter permease subunit [Enterococcus sp. LJL128]